MRPQSESNAVFYLIALGLNDCQISRATGIPRGTIRDWRHGKNGLTHARNDCPRCGSGELVLPTYSYLLGLYLGDGCLSLHERNVFRLRITLDQKYPLIVSECAAAIRQMRQPEAKVGFSHNPGCIEVNSYWKHWPCLFPQHGAGPKHLRPIRLVTWQQEIADQHPRALLRGLVHSDGYRGLNFVNGKGYPRYQFSNASDDIRAIFCRACDVLGIRWRRMNARNISIAHRAEVAKLDAFIGPKS